MNRREAKFWELLKEHLPGEKERIENMVGDGVPDVSAAWNGVDYWVELKASTNVKKETSPEKLCRDTQLVWHARRGRHGSLIFIIVKYSFGVYVYKWVKYATYERIVIAQKIGNGFDWTVLENALQTILYNKQQQRGGL